jgi:outer membrane usher protein
VVVRDAFGGEQSFGGSYYITTSVLSKGLHQYQYAIGAERLRPFDTVWSYGRPVATGTHRLGLTDAVTVGGRAEIESGLVSAGPTMTTRLGRFGALEASAAISRASRAGVAGALAYEYIGGPGGVSIAWRQASQDYETLTTRRVASAPVREVFASATTRLGRHLTSGVSWQSQDLRNGGDRPRRASVTTSFPVGGKASLFLSLSRARVDGIWSTGAFASMSMGLGPRASAGASIERMGEVTRAGLDVQRSAPVGPGMGYRAQLAGLGSDAELLDAEIRAQGRWAQADVRQSMVSGQRETWAQVNGALVAIGGRVHAARPVQDGYALVRVPDVPGVRAYVSHQEMGRTDQRGDLLLPNLLAYYGNRISIADTDVPVDRTLASRDVILAPPYRGGAIAEFPAPRQRRAAGRLVASGRMPALTGPRANDAVVVIETPAGPVETWLGPQGEFYIEGLGPGEYVIRVVSGEARCEASVSMPADDVPVVQLGDVPCAGGHGERE